MRSNYKTKKSMDYKPKSSSKQLVKNARQLLKSNIKTFGAKASLGDIAISINTSRNCKSSA